MGLPSKEKSFLFPKNKRLIDRYIVLEAVPVFNNCSGFVYS